MTSAEAYDGTYSQAIAQEGSTEPGEYARITTDVVHPFDSAKAVQLNFRAKIPSLALARITAKLEFYDDQGMYISNAYKEITNTTVSFTVFELYTLIPDNTQKVAIILGGEVTDYGGYYRVYIDDVSLTEQAANMNQTQVGIVSGELRFSTLSGSFLDVKLTNSGIMETVATTTAAITDDTGRAEGWNLKISATNFISDELNDPSSEGQAAYALMIPISAMKLETSSVNHVAGQQVHPVHGPVAHSITVSGSSQTIVKADPGFGSGSYQVVIGYRLVIPKTLQIVSQSGTGSKFKVGDYVGARSSIYTATLNFSAGTGL
ncbi:hypothetical protein D3P09_20315 [Paenibacillus pinisoli]|uniref:WxL domain-containing protein n=1 Tax=Paenibacillus pinisoli TaxID=1276110 RepID=A0A3A6PX24_9BACL|nr:hypothetical protein D3P09_20315 [Paenibacillus pinisoli]